MANTSEGGKKAAETRGKDEMAKMGQKGGKASSGQHASPTGASSQGKNVKNAPSEMGKKGGKASGQERSDQ